MKITEIPMPSVTRFALRKLDSLLKGRTEDRKEGCPICRDHAGSTVKGVQMSKCHKCVWYRGGWTPGEGRLVPQALPGQSDKLVDHLHQVEHIYKCTSLTLVRETQ